jgi:hypothetical protein
MMPSNLSCVLLPRSYVGVMTLRKPDTETIRDPPPETSVVCRVSRIRQLTHMSPTSSS